MTITRVKSFPSGRCVAQRMESNIAAGGSYTIKSGAGRAKPWLRRGVPCESGWSNAPIGLPFHGSPDVNFGKNYQKISTIYEKPVEKNRIL